MKKLWVLIIFLAGCTQLNLPLQKITKPYQDETAYREGSWTLLAESLSKDWYYDPITLVQDNDQLISFRSYWIPNQKSEASDFFRSGIVGPYLQKIDCIGNNQLSESLVDQSCDLSAAVDPPPNVKPGASECWNKIKPKTAMAYIYARVCGRKFALEKTTNFYLYQVDRISHNPKDVEGGKLASPIFYEVLNNEFIVIDTKRDIREMKISSYHLDENASHESDYIYSADCENRMDSLSKIGSIKLPFHAVGNATSLSGVAFNRICENHGSYMQQVKAYTK